MKFLFSILLCCIPWFALAMEPEFGDGTLRLTGEIRIGDYDKLIASFKKNPQEFVAVQTVSLDSPGGSVSEAIKLAQFIRDTSRITFIDSNAKCMSSCFFLFVAGGIRFFDTGKLGIHRPYYAPSEFKTLSSSKARDAYEKLDTRVRQFLTDMRVPEEIVRQMFATPSSSIKLLSATEFAQQIGTKQPWYEELAKSACPSQEFRCMAIKGRQDRLTMVKTYLGQPVALEQAGWATEYQRILTANLQALMATPDPAVPSRPISSTPKVDAAYPGWQRLVRTPEFLTWKKSQPGYVQDLSSSEAEEDAIRVLDLYKSRASSQPSMLFLSCDLQWTTGSGRRVHLDMDVDLDNRKLGTNDADITEETIVSKTVANGYPSTTRINRRSGAISIFLQGLGNMDGTCSRSPDKRF